MNWLLVTALSCAVVSTSGACTHADPLARQLKGCARTNEVDCRQLVEGLEALFAGRSNRADRFVAHRLSSAALQIIRDEASTGKDVSSERGIVVDAVRQCAAGADDACNRIASVLTGLFTGADACLDASTDRLLARAMASRLVSITLATDKEIAGRRDDARR